MSMEEVMSGEGLNAALLLDDVEKSLMLDEVQELSVPCRSFDDFSAAQIEQPFGLLRPAGILRELGYSCACTLGHCKELLSLFVPLSEKDVAEILGVVSRTYSSLQDCESAHSTLCAVLFQSSSPVSDSLSLATWQPDILMEAIAQLEPELQWDTVAGNFDHDGFFVPDQKAFSHLMSFYRKFSRDAFPIASVCGDVWKNTEGQLSFLRHATMAPPEVFSFAQSRRKQVLPEGLSKLASGCPNQAWLSLDLLEVLCRLGEEGCGEEVRSLLDLAKDHCPELLLTGSMQVKTEWNLIQNEYCSELFKHLFLTGKNTLLLHHVWLLNPEQVMRSMVENWTQSKDSLSRIFDICHELKNITRVLSSCPFAFALDLAILATRREYILLERWLNDTLAKHKESFFFPCLFFLRERSVTGQHLSLDISNAFLTALQNFCDHIPPLKEELNRVVTYIARINPQFFGSGDPVERLEEASSDIEEEANEYFNKIYCDRMTTDEVIDMLKRFNHSSVERERELFACMIRCLFDEYKFFPRYPDRELKLTAILFGKLIKHQLISSITLGIGLRYVLDSVRKPPDSQMFTFGLSALDQFTDRLLEWPQYCNHLVQIAHLREAQPGLVESLQRALRRSSEMGNSASVHVTAEHDEAIAPNPASRTSLPPIQVQEERPNSGGLGRSTSELLAPLSQRQLQSNARPARTASVPAGRGSAATPGFGSALNIGTLVAAAQNRDFPIEHPGSAVEDKVGFIVNNLSKANVESKAKECLDIVQEKYFSWFAQYMVMNRASIEPNFHDLYLQFLDKMNSKTLHREVVKASYENCKVLLRSELIKSSSEERSLLKNLGSWLGKLTIGQNKVLLAKEIDPKSLIIEAYEKGLMIAVIPFTSKILEPCATSAVYQPPNPWTMAIVNLLAEICALPNLKMNLKFDIEVLCRNLSLELKDLKPTQLLKGRRREMEGNPDFATKEISDHSVPTSMGHDFLPEHVSSHSSSNISFASQNTGSASQEDDKVVSFTERVPVKPPSSPISLSYSSLQIPNLTSFVVVNQSKLGGSSPQQLLQIQRTVPMAMERAIKEIIGPVVERSVTIACMTARELISKDFALETDENRIMHSANLMVASLAGSLAHVTCKEPLRLAMINHIRALLQTINVPADGLEQTVHVVTNDNLDLGCAVIEKNATEKALRDMDDTFANILAAKRSQREVWLATYAQGALRLPEALRPKPGRLSPVQQRVFEDFARLPWQNQQPPAASAPMVVPSNLPRGPSSQTGLVHHASVPVAPTLEANSDEMEVRVPSPSSISDGGVRSQDVPADGITLGPSDGSAFDMKQDYADAEAEARAKDEPKLRQGDPTGLRDQVNALFDDCIRFFNGSNVLEKPTFMSQLVQGGYLKGDDTTDRFFKLLTELAVTKSTQPDVGVVSLAPIDVYAKLIAMLVKHFTGDPSMTKVNLLNRVLNITVRVIQKDADEKKAFFQPRPYFRLFFTLLAEFNIPDPILDMNNNFQLLAAFANALHLLQPLKVPGYSFVWLELISHRMFMPKQLLSPSKKGWPFFQRLLVALFKFMDPYLRNAELSDPVRLLYKGTLRVLLVLLHDFPEFLCEYHFSFCDVIPPSCIQMRNLILSAFPRNMRLPDPFTPNLKVDLLPEISQAPCILSDVDGALRNKHLKGEIDEYLKTRQSLSMFFMDLKQRLLLPASEAVSSGTRYNVPLINSLVLYVGMQAVQQLHKTTPQQLAVPTTPITHSGPMDIFQKLIVELDTEGRYLFLNAIANQLRYPNNHTHYFSCVLLYLFAEASEEIIQEQITRVLLERLIVNRPHPWGLLITFIELIKNPRYSFWNHSFTRCAPEIERLFDSVARSCMGPPLTRVTDVDEQEAVKG